jgi:hypothetical protein
MFTFPVKPDATPEEVRAVVEDDQGGQIFSQAVRFTLCFWLLEVFLNPLSAHELEQIWRVSCCLSRGTGTS